MRRVDQFGKQCMRSGSLAMNGYYVQSSIDRSNQEFNENMSFEDGLRSLKVKLDVIALNVQIDIITNMFEQKRNVNTFNCYHVICYLCGVYHATHTYKQVQDVNYYNEFEYCNPYFDQYGPNWGNCYAYNWNNQYNYSDSTCFYDYQHEFVQYESKSS